MMMQQKKIKQPTTWKHEGIFSVKVIVTKAYSSKLENDVKSG